VWASDARVVLEKEEKGGWRRGGARFKPGATRQRRGGRALALDAMWLAGRGGSAWSASRPCGRDSRGLTATGVSGTACARACAARSEQGDGG
jgi:hypothetical protein